MSLVDFIKHQEVKEIYTRYAVNKFAVPKPDYIIECEDTRIASNIGTAFDYVVRLRLNALAKQNGINCVENTWIAEEAVKIMQDDSELSLYHKKWTRLMIAARALQDEMVHNPEVNPLRVVTCAQYLGCADLLFRVGTFRSDFTASVRVTKELLKLDEMFVYEDLLPLNGDLYLNPNLCAGSYIGGADPDIISGNILYDIKTTIKPTVDASKMRQVCAYAALSDWLGIIDRNTQRIIPHIEYVGFIFSRQGINPQYNLEEIFGGYYNYYKEEMIIAAKNFALNKTNQPNF